MAKVPGAGGIYTITTNKGGVGGEMSYNKGNCSQRGSPMIPAPLRDMSAMLFRRESRDESLVRFYPTHSEL